MKMKPFLLRTVSIIISLKMKKLYLHVLRINYSKAIKILTQKIGAIFQKKLLKLGLISFI